MSNVGNEPPLELADVQAGTLPARYGYRMQDVFLERVLGLLAPGARVLDVGAGRAPAVAIELRPAGTRYLGLDLSLDELRAAPSGAYDELLLGDVTRPLPAGPPYDLIVSWQVLEHVAPLSVALENMRRALRPGGTLVAQLSGSFSFFAMAARVVPHALRVRGMETLIGHQAQPKFPTRYDRCWASALERMLASWSRFEIVPFYRGAAPYLSPLRHVRRAYLLYENLLELHAVRNLATHYLITATR